MKRFILALALSFSFIQLVSADDELFDAYQKAMKDGQPLVVFSNTEVRTVSGAQTFVLKDNGESYIGIYLPNQKEGARIPADVSDERILALIDGSIEDEALAEVNAARARRGLRPFIRDDGLMAAARAAAAFRAANRIRGHTANDFGFLPSGSSAPAAGCGALEPSWGWGTCCTYENWTYAGAGLVVGSDGLRYMHLFVR